MYIVVYKVGCVDKHEIFDTRDDFENWVFNNRTAKFRSFQTKEIFVKVELHQVS